MRNALCLLLGIQLLLGMGSLSLAGDGAVRLTFQNTLTTSVSLVSVDESDREKVLVEDLPAGQETTVNALPGNLWRVKVGEELIAEYEVDNREDQAVDLAVEASWQLPVKVVLKNDTDFPVSISILRAESANMVLRKSLPPDQAFTKDGVAPRTVLQVKRDEELVAEYLVGNRPEQIASIADLVEIRASEVTLRFLNKGDKPVDIFWAHPDGVPRLVHPEVPGNRQAVQRCFPGQAWLFRQDGKFVGGYQAADGKEQMVDIVAVVTQLVAASEAVASGTAQLVPANRNSIPPDQLGSAAKGNSKSSGTSSRGGRPRPPSPKTLQAGSNNPPGTTPIPTGRSTPLPGNARPANQTPDFKVDSIVGRYQRMPVENDWHEVIITKDDGRPGVFVWQNKAGKSWWLFANGNDPLLTTDETNPYYGEGEAFRQVRVEFVPDSNGNLTGKIKGLKFLKSEFYLKVSESTRPD